MVTLRKRVVLYPDGSFRLVDTRDIPAPRPSQWSQRLVCYCEGFDTLSGYINIYRRHEALRVWGHARIIVFLPWKWRVTWTWLRSQRWPTWEWTRFA